MTVIEPGEWLNIGSATGTGGRWPLRSMAHTSICLDAHVSTRIFKLMCHSVVADGYVSYNFANCSALSVDSNLK